MLKEINNPPNDTLYVKCEYRCLEGKAPSVETVEAMYAEMDAHIKSKGRSFKELREEQYWFEALSSDDMILLIIKELK